MIHRAYLGRKHTFCIVSNYKFDSLKSMQRNSVQNTKLHRHSEEKYAANSILQYLNS